ncbi:hypothetical protein [Streptomyces cinereoruber]|nr:hypothetical protein [Streptomyces cinereoruber]MBB4161739.1 hypothetical protein [Streptomyces cinereoruber]MBY8820055.1 hypothetical protein [Streptomyces cinereoruber]NIH65424.1 hypothetical protein [Streptomyces cinereoruber]
MALLPRPAAGPFSCSPLLFSGHCPPAGLSPKCGPSHCPPQRRASVFVGKTSVRGFTKGGQGYAELVLPDADPQQRRDLERAERYRFKLYLDGQELYASPELTLHYAERDGDGALAVTGHP